MAFDSLPPGETIDEAIAALRESGFNVFFVNDGEAARDKVLQLIPAGAEVMNVSSRTLASLGLDREIMESGRYVSIRAKLLGMDRATRHKEKQMLGSAPPWVVGSVQAVTTRGTVMIASATGSQLSSYAFGATRVVWVVGAQKIVPGIEEGMRRIYEHCEPAEDERSRSAYGRSSTVNKVLTVYREVQRNRVTIILVNEVLGV